MKLLWRIFYPVLIATWFSVVVSMQLPEADPLLLSLFSTLCTIPVLLYLFFKDRRRQGMSRVGMTLASSPIVVLFGAFGSIFANGLITISHIGSLFSGYTQTMEHLYAPPLWLQLLAVGVVIPIGEELMFRGLAFGRLRESMSFLRAAIFSGLFFGLYHGNVVQGIYAFLLGVAMSLTYEAYQTLAAPILFHVAANISSILLTKYLGEEVFGGNVSLYLITVVSGCLAACAAYQIEKRRKFR